MRMAFFGVLVLLCVAGGLLMSIQSVSGPPVPPDRIRPERVVLIPLLGPVAQVEGVAVPPRVLAESVAFFQVKEPCEVAIALPGGRSVRLPVKTAFINVNDGVVVDVDLLPLMRSVPYREAISELQRFLKSIDLVPDERMRKQMADWPDDVPGFDPVNRPGVYPHKYHASTSVPIAEKTYLWAELRPAADGGWFVVLTLQADEASRRALWDPDFQRGVSQSTEAKE